MKKLVFTLPFVALATPLMAAGTPEEAMEIALRNSPCGDREIVSARFIDDTTIGVRCEGDDGAIVAGATGATNFVPVAGGIFALVLGAAAIGNGGSSTSDTQ